jgi:signal recognition particle subunit SRP68
MRDRVDPSTPTAFNSSDDDPYEARDGRPRATAGRPLQHPPIQEEAVPATPANDDAEQGPDPDPDPDPDADENHALPTRTVQLQLPHMRTRVRGAEALIAYRPLVSLEFVAQRRAHTQTSLAGEMEEEQGGEGGPVAPVSLPIHATIQQMQSRNGLRHSDYAQYRRYATRRLRRVRTSKDVNFLLSKGKTFLKGKRVSAEDITSGRHLLVPLLMAERAWAYAMQLKLDAEDGVPCSVRRHMCRRLAKATKFARELEQLCTSAADERTCLEATAYAEWMVGIYSLEREQWMEAMEHLSTASRVCTELGRVGSLADQDLFSVRAEEIEPSLRYCKYQLQRGGGAGLDPSDMLKLQQDACSPASDDLLAAKLAKVVSETRQVEAHALESVTWRGHRLLLRSEKLRMSLVVANDRVRMLEDAGTADPADPKSKSKVEGLYLRVFNAYDDSLSIIHKELALLESEGKGARAEAERKQFLQLSDFAKHAKLAIMLKRNLGLIAELKSEPQPEVADIVHVCDSLLQNVREMRACLERADTDVAEDDMDEEDALNELLRLEANESK